MTKTILRLACSLWIASLLWGCTQTQVPYQEANGTIFHTVYRAVYQSENDQQDLIREALNSVDRIANPFDSTSLLSDINYNRSSTLDSTLVYLLNLAQQVHIASGKAYDVTISPLVNAWGFGFTKPIEHIAQTQVDSLLTFVGMQHIKIDGQTITKDDPRVKIDLSSIAKGYAADCVAAALERQGVENYMVEIGGEIAYKGVNPQGKPWGIGIDTPSIDQSAEAHPLQQIIHLEGHGGLATSGNYRNFKLDENGKPYGHTISPILGYPVQNDVLSASVLAPNCALADALATAFMAAGSQKAIEMAKSFPEVDYLLILAGTEAGQYQTIASPGWTKRITKK